MPPLIMLDYMGDRVLWVGAWFSSSSVPSLNYLVHFGFPCVVEEEFDVDLK